MLNLLTLKSLGKFLLVQLLMLTDASSQLRKHISYLVSLALELLLRFLELSAQFTLLIVDITLNVNDLS